jgi:hypothetical protein
MGKMRSRQASKERAMQVTELRKSSSGKKIDQGGGNKNDTIIEPGSCCFQQQLYIFYSFF